MLKEFNNIKEIELTVLDVLKNLVQDFQFNDVTENIEIDSLNFVRLIVELEMLFEFEFEDEYLILQSLPNVKSISEYIWKKIKMETI